MMLHSIVPPEMIFPSCENPCMYYRLRHGFAEYTKTNGQPVLRRIDSTDPADYLNPNYEPGSKAYNLQ